MNRPVENLIYDRTQADVENKTLKGQLNASDLNRVESWCKYLAERLTLMGYSITITTKTTWIQTDMRTATEMERIRVNIKKIMDGYYYITQIKPNAEYFDYIKANNWEEILAQINFMMEGMQGYYVYGGVSRVGQNMLWQNRFRHFEKQTTSFDTRIIPTSWTLISSNFYYSQDALGTWEISQDRGTTSNNCMKAFDNDTTTFFQTSTYADDEFCYLYLNSPVPIKPATIFTRIARIGTGGKIQGLNPSTNNWDDLAEISQHSSNITQNTYNITTNNFYNKFRLLLTKYSTYGASYVYEFNIASGEYFK